MASSVNPQAPESGLAAGSGYGYQWRSKGSGPETVITSQRQVPMGVPAIDGSAFGNELIPRLFPSSYDAETVSGISFGHFTIQKRIGTGGMGSVFLALDERLKREIALKVLSPSLSIDPLAVQRFQNEAQAAARLDHDNIARVFYCGEDSGLHYIAYEYVPGQNLRDLIRVKGWLEPAEAVNYAIQLTAALNHSCSAGVIHRDIKPSNVLITPFGRVKLVDLGLARKTSIESSFELTVPGTTLGTFDYISPEQARDPHNVDVRSDIYSMGCTLYHMLTGEPPYPEGTVLQKLLDHQDKEPPDPTLKNRRVSPKLSSVVRKMMASQPNQRYASPGDLLRDLLIVARSLGAGAVPIDGQVWLTATRFKPPFWQNNFGWVATTCALCLLVSAVQVYSTLNQKSEPSFDGSSRVATSNGSRPSNRGTDDTGDDDTGLRPLPPINESIAKSAANPIGSVVEQSDIFGSNKPTAAAGNNSATSATPSKTKSPLLEFDPLPASLRPGTVPDAAADEKPAAPAGPVAAIQIVKGKSYETLEAACAEAAETGSIIELSYNGLRASERPIRLSNKKVSIRAADGFRPTILFAPHESASDGTQPQMITVAGGWLELFNVDLVMAVPNRMAVDRWTMFSLERPEKVQLKGVNLTISNPHNKSACFFEQRAQAGQVLDNMGVKKTGIPSVPPELLLTESFVRGVGDFVLMRDPTPSRFVLKDSVVGVDGNLLSINPTPESAGTEKESNITLELEHVTCLLNQSLLFVDGVGELADKLPPVFMDARNNVISCGTGRPMIVVRGLDDFMDFKQTFKQSFSWKGDRNFFNAIDTFLEVSTLQQASNRSLDYADWKRFWGSANDGFGSANSPIVWRSKLSDRSFVNLTKESVELAPDSSAVRGASDGEDAGATIKKLPQSDR